MSKKWIANRKIHYTFKTLSLILYDGWNKVKKKKEKIFCPTAIPHNFIFGNWKFGGNSAWKFCISDIKMFHWNMKLTSEGRYISDMSFIEIGASFGFQIHSYFHSQFTKGAPWRSKLTISTFRYSNRALSINKSLATTILSIAFA